MTVAEVREKFLKYMEKQGHAIVPSASLVPENDPTTLFTGSGMQPLIPYLLGQPHPSGKRIANSQKSFRAEDIEEVGDNRHTTFFEMLGNWSFGDYWKQEQLSWFFDFLTDEKEGIGLKPERLYVSVFSGGYGIYKDSDSIEIWTKLFAEKGIQAKYAKLDTEEAGSQRGMNPEERIFGYRDKNWWSRSGPPDKMPAGEPGGPDSEVFYEFASVEHDPKFGENCHPNCDCGRFLEIGNSVFMEFKKKEDGDFENLAQQNVDFGGGLERLTAAANDNPDIFAINVFEEVERVLEISTRKKYTDYSREFRVILDHVRAAVFLLADGVKPANTERGYVLRRLLRRAIRFANKLEASDLTATNTQREFTLHRSVIVDVADTIIKVYFPAINLINRAGEIIPEIEKEEEKFKTTLSAGLKELRKNAIPFIQKFEDGILPTKRKLSEVLLLMFTTHGFPFENSIEEIQNIRRELNFPLLTEDRIERLRLEFQNEFSKHQDLSRTASAGTFKGGLADHSEKTTQLHTAHHLLLKALQVVLGPQVKQRGSNITSERLRLDFSHDAKMTDDQKKEVERIVNEKIAEDLPVIRSEMPLEEAEKLGAEHEFGQKYPARVSVYSVGPDSATAEDPQFGQAFSIEFCGGPHVARTGEIKGTFRIQKEEASSAGVRRIKAVVE